VLSGGVIAAQGRTVDILTDEALMASHRLELPYGFDPHRC
jgi:cobalt/nickel transport system ATP-binding protein